MKNASKAIRAMKLEKTSKSIFVLPQVTTSSHLSLVRSSAVVARRVAKRFGSPRNGSEFITRERSRSCRCSRGTSGGTGGGRRIDMPSGQRGVERAGGARGGGCARDGRLERGTGAERRGRRGRRARTRERQLRTRVRSDAQLAHFAYKLAPSSTFERRLHTSFLLAMNIELQIRIIYLYSST